MVTRQREVVPGARIILAFTGRRRKVQHPLGREAQAGKRAGEIEVARHGPHAGREQGLALRLRARQTEEQEAPGQPPGHAQGDVAATNEQDACPPPHA
ncbi:MAG: hypothetical protein F9K47_15280 [Burkholderiales bacterium]|nr:MAG: hypothetical protein F9K47_15280 [Burkholderiales bacterium]